MGEIADALRRARGQNALRADPRPAAPAPTAPAAPDRLESGADLGRLATAPGAPSAAVETLKPTEPAIALEDGAAIEACRQVALRLRVMLDARGARSVALVSAVHNEGKTTSLCNIGLALASLSRGREVALVDLDLRRPSLARVLDVRAAAGVDDVLKGRASLDEARICVKRPAIDLYVASGPQHSAHELLVLPSFAQMVDELERRYSTVLIDTAPALLVPDASLILHRVPFCVPVALAGRSRARDFQRLVDLLPHQQILGEILTGGRGSGRYYEAYLPERKNEAPPRRRWLGGAKKR